MNFELTKSNIKGREIATITIFPSDNMEREFFNTIFKGEVKFDMLPNSDKIIISPKGMEVLITELVLPNELKNEI